MDFSKLNIEFNNMQNIISKYNVLYQEIKNKIKNNNKDVSKYESKIKSTKNNIEKETYKIIVLTLKDETSFLEHLIIEEEINGTKSRSTKNI